VSLPILSVHYDEFDIATYAGCSVSVGEHEFTVDTGNPAADYLAVSVIAHVIAGEWVMCSSSVDHFIQDGGNLEVMNG
jgi:hypothetical protein